jgi:heme exporter protein D
MMTHAFYVYGSYGFAGLVTVAVTLWTWLDGRARRREWPCLKPPVSAAARRKTPGCGRHEHRTKPRTRNARSPGRQRRKLAATPSP